MLGCGVQPTCGSRGLQAYQSTSADSKRMRYNMSIPRQVLNMKPAETLGMLEEAAGTRMYEMKKEGALRTLDKKQLKVDEIEKVRHGRPPGMEDHSANLVMCSMVPISVQALQSAAAASVESCWPRPDAPCRRSAPSSCKIDLDCC